MTTLTSAQIESAFGHLEYSPDPRRKGAIVVAREWIAANIVRLTPPWDLRAGTGQHVNVIACHRLIEPDIHSILDELLAQRSQHLIVSWDGCWVPRHMLWKPAKPLSRHSWGIAVDLNSSAYPYGSLRKQNPRLVQMFARRGWICGADWHPPDPMHFEPGPAWLAQHRQPKPVPPADVKPVPIVQCHQPDPADASVTVLLDGKPLPPGRLIAGSVYLPVRAIAEALGCTVAYDSTTRTVRLTRP